MMHSQTIMQILVSLFFIITRSGHPKRIGSSQALDVQ